eukprot:TRINITY_DN8122_c0_g4_i1.p1 TRINITY_DN8122_c0_g4~~TRINITY_DN8122_c0_g4_i1.p1  ORF type:complete len:513 (+),score=129.61 TRINITY_DN8122_c0_g4_i1:32-1570(+)
MEEIDSDGDEKKNSLEYKPFDEAGPRDVPLMMVNGAILDLKGVMRHMIMSAGKCPRSGFAQLLLDDVSLDILRDFYWWVFLRFLMNHNPEEARDMRAPVIIREFQEKTPVLPLHMYSFKDPPASRSLSLLEKISAPGTRQHGLPFDSISTCSSPRGTRADTVPSPLASSVVSSSSKMSSSSHFRRLPVDDREELVEMEEHELYGRISDNYLIVVRKMNKIKPAALQDIYHLNYPDFIAQAACFALEKSTPHILPPSLKQEVLGFITYWTSGVQRTDIDNWTVAYGGYEDTTTTIVHSPVPPAPAPVSQQAAPFSVTDELLPAPPTLAKQVSKRVFVRKNHAQGRRGSMKPQEGKKDEVGKEITELKGELTDINKRAKVAFEKKMKAKYDSHERERERETERLQEEAPKRLLTMRSKQDRGHVYVMGAVKKLKPLPKNVMLLVNKLKNKQYVPPWFEFGRVGFRKTVNKVVLGNFCTTDNSPLMQHIIHKKLYKEANATKPADMLWSVAEPEK